MTQPDDTLTAPPAGLSSAGPVAPAGGVIPAPAQPAVVDGVDVDAVAVAVQGCAGVSALTGGRFGEVVSYLPGRRIDGVLIRDGRVKVQVRSRWGVPAADLATLISVTLMPLTGHRPVDVMIADIDDPPAPA